MCKATWIAQVERGNKSGKLLKSAHLLHWHGIDSQDWLRQCGKLQHDARIGLRVAAVCSLH
jgi:hypothetical protein